MCSPEFAFSRWIKKSNSSSKNFRFAAQKKAQVRHIYHSAFLSCVLTKMGLENAPCAFTVSFSNFRKNLFQQSITMLLQNVVMTSTPDLHLHLDSLFKNTTTHYLGTLGLHLPLAIALPFYNLLLNAFSFSLDLLRCAK